MRKPFPHNVSSGTGKGRQTVIALLAGAVFVGSALAGNMTFPADASGNTVKVVARSGFDDSQITAGDPFADGDIVYAPLSTPGDPNSVSLRGNVVTVRDGNIVSSPDGATHVVGGGDWGLTGTAEVLGNTLNVAGGMHGKTGIVILFGGMSRGIGPVVGNTVTVTGGDVSGMVYGGYSPRGIAGRNRVTAISTTISGIIYGSATAKGNADDSMVNVTDSNIRGTVYGSRSWIGNASGNRVTMTGGGINGTVFGGYAPRGNADNNTVHVADTRINGGISSGQSSRGSASRNMITAINATIGEGGFISGGTSSEGSTNDNVVTVKGGAVNETVFGGYSTGGNANGNTVTVTDGAVNGTLFGGNSPRGSANGNVLSLKNAAVGTTITGGWGATSAMGNVVTLSGQTLFTSKTDVLGGAGGGTVSGNALTLDRFRQTGEGGVKDVHGFDKLSFIGITAGQRAPVLTATGTVDLAGSRTTLRFDGEPANVRLIDAPKFIMTGATIDDVIYGENRYRFHWDTTGSAVLSGTSPINQ
ncbi:MAG: hypothetical protein LBK01_03650 [Burkholderiaceae bacterium]|jgi:hypothetical protein|nr:hypothetical protein [Burkholderiaceae bacterium]